MSFQVIIDNAGAIEYSCRPIVSQTIARSGMIRSVSRGNAIWKFRVSAPGGRYSDYRRALVDLEATGQAVVQNIQINNPGYDYILGYQGNITTPTRSLRIPDNGNIIYDDNPIASGWRFRKGDLIQVYNHVYMVENDIGATGTGEIQLNRPLLLGAGQGSSTINCNIGTNCEFKVKCISFPKHSITGYDVLQFDGDFIFQEVIDLA